VKIKNILITGVAGFVGSKLATKLVFKNFTVIGIDAFLYSNNSLDHLIPFKNFHLVEGDVRDKILMKKLLRMADIIIPLAALVGAPLCEKKKRESKEVNLDAVKFIVDSIKKDQKILFPSTDSVYGKMKNNSLLRENDFIAPISHYGKLKEEAERYLLQNKNSVVLRLGTVFGLSYRFREDLLVNNFVKISLKNKKLNIYEGLYRRNFICIDDVVDGFLFVINNFSKFKGEIFNLGLFLGNFSKLDLAKLVKKYIKDLKISNKLGKKDLDQRDYIVSVEKMKKKGFVATTSLDDGVKQLIKYLDKKPYSKNFNYE